MKGQTSRFWSGIRSYESMLLAHAESRPRHRERSPEAPAPAVVIPTKNVSVVTVTKVSANTSLPVRMDCPQANPLRSHMAERRGEVREYKL